MTPQDITTRRTPQGVELSALVCGYLFKHQYIDIEPREAVRQFLEVGNLAERYGKSWASLSLFKGY